MQEARKGASYLRLLVAALLLVLGRGAAAQGVTVSEAGTCDGWVEEYIQFHRQTRGTPGARYLVQTCWGKNCADIGGRLKGILWLARVAAITNRVLLVEWMVPTMLERFYMPNRINWSVDTTVPSETGYGHNKSAVIDTLTGPWKLADVLMAAHDKSREVVHVKVETFESAPADINWYTWQRKVPESTARLFYPLDMYSPNARCLFQALFKPSEAVQQGVAQEMQSLFGSQDAKFIAIHFHTNSNDLSGEARRASEDVGRTMISLLNALTCARSVASDLGDPNMQLLFVTDDNQLRTHVGTTYSQLLQGAKASQSQWVHLDTAWWQNDGNVTFRQPELYLPGFVDMGLMAKATCLVSGAHGAARMGYYLGNSICHVGSTLPCQRVDAAGMPMPAAPPAAAVLTAATARRALRG